MTAGKWLMLVGALAFVGGLALHYAPWLLSWFGKLPGDIRIRGEHGYLFIPITSMLIVSLLLSLVIQIFFRR